MSRTSNAIDWIDVCRLISAKAKALGSQAALAEKAGVSAVYLSQILNAERRKSDVQRADAADRVLAAAGIRRVVTTHYEMIETA